MLYYLLHRRTLYIFAWLMALGVIGGRFYHAIHGFDESRPVGDPDRRVDGNSGHLTIDFGGQWLMGRMLVRGHGRQLFHRYRQWEVACEAFHVDQESPNATERDSATLVGTFMGRDPTEEWKRVAGGTGVFFSATSPWEAGCFGVCR